MLLVTPALPPAADAATAATAPPDIVLAATCATAVLILAGCL